MVRRVGVPQTPGVRTGTRWQRARRTGELLCAAAVLSALGYGIASYAREAEQFYAKTVAIEGLKLLDRFDVTKASGVTSETNLLFLNPEEVAHRVEELAGVRRCAVRRILPDTVLLEIEERVPAATLLVRNHAYLIDAEGVVLKAMKPGELPVGPFITQAPLPSVLSAGARVEDETVHMALAVREALANSSLKDVFTISELAAYAPNDIRMYCSELPYEIRWGREDPRTAARRLEALWAETGGQPECEQYLDLRFGQWVACK